MSQKPLILVVDDEQAIRTMLRRYLTDEGFAVAEAADGATMRQVLDRNSADLVLLDLMLPGEDGLSLARYIRRRSATPIIMLTGKGDVIDRVAGLEAGADDYIAKPFHLREVLARIRTVLRRTPAGTEAHPAAPGSGPIGVAGLGVAGAESTGAQGTGTGGTAAEAGGKQLSFGEWRVDLLRRELRRETGEAVELTTGEFELLSAFLRSPNRVLTRGQLMDLVKGRDWAVNDRAIDAQVVRLRRKIERDPRRPELIKTVRGAGYILASPVAAARRA